MTFEQLPKWIRGRGIPSRREAEGRGRFRHMVIHAAWCDEWHESMSLQNMGTESNKERLSLEKVVRGCLAEKVTLEGGRDQLVPVLKALERPSLWLRWELGWIVVLCKDEDKGRGPLGKVVRSGGSSKGSGIEEGSGHRESLGIVSSGWMEALRLGDILRFRN